MKLFLMRYLKTVFHQQLNLIQIINNAGEYIFEQFELQSVHRRNSIILLSVNI